MTQIYNYFMGYHSLSKIFVQIFFFMGHHSFYKKFVAKSRFFRFSRLDDITKMFRDWRQSIKFTRLPSLYIYHAPAGAWTELYRIILNYTGVSFLFLDYYLAIWNRGSVVLPSSVI